MRKVLLFATVISLSVTFVFLNSCKKDTGVTTENRVVDGALISLVKDWFQKEKKNYNLTVQAKIDSVENDINWSSAEKTNLSQGKLLFTFELNQRIGTNTNNIERIAFIKDKSGDIILGSIFLYKPAAKQNEEEYLLRETGNILDNRTVEYQGSLTVLTISKAFLSEYEYKEGRLASIKILKEKTKDDQSQRIASCIDWYLVTTYYWADGSISRTEDYLFTSCNDDCQTTRMIRGNALRIDCGGGGGSGDPDLAQDKICPASFRNFGPITSNGMSYAMNVYGLNFNDNSGHINSFDVWVNVQNYIQSNSMNTVQSSANPGFMPPGLADHTPMEIIQTIPSLNQLLLDGDIAYGYNSSANEYGWSFNNHAYSIICALAADWAATNTEIYAPNPAVNPLAPSTFTAQFNGILRAIIPGSRVNNFTDPSFNSSYAVYSPTGNCN